MLLLSGMFVMVNVRNCNFASSGADELKLYWSNGLDFMKADHNLRYPFFELDTYLYRDY